MNDKSRELEAKIDEFQKETGASDDQVIEWFFEGYAGKQKESPDQIFGKWLRGRTK